MYPNYREPHKDELNDSKRFNINQVYLRDYLNDQEQSRSQYKPIIPKPIIPKPIMSKTVEEENIKTTELGYDHINPSHYKQYPIESIDMMEKIFGIDAVYNFCLLNAFKYRMRMATKPGVPVEQDLLKEQWYLSRAKQLLEKKNDND